MADLRANRFFETVSALTSNGTGLWHAVDGCNGSQAVRLKAGLSGDRIIYRFDLQTRQTPVLQPSRPGTFMVTTSSGFTPVKLMP